MRRTPIWWLPWRCVLHFSSSHAAQSAGSSQNEAELVAALKRGDDTAYEQLVRSYGPRLLATARRYLANDDDASDALQDAFLSAFKAIDRFQEDARLSTWLHRIVVNASLMKLRSKRRKPETSIEDLLPEFLPDGHMTERTSAWADSAVETAERNETRTIVRDSINRLPEDYRSVLLLRDIDQYDTQQTADMLGLSTSAVKTRLHRARQALRTQLDRTFGQGTP